MSSPNPPNTTQSQQQQDKLDQRQQRQNQPSIDHSTRIRDLSTIDADIASLLQSAGLALKSLSSHALSPPATASPTADLKREDEDIELDGDEEDGEPHTPLKKATAAFSTHNTEYLQTVQFIQARLRRQAYALEEAGIIPSDAEASNVDTTTATPAAPGKGGAKDVMPITNGGLGKFDVGWLNSRRDEVGRRKEMELWREMRALVEGLVEREEKLVNDVGGDSNGQSAKDDDDMEDREDGGLDAKEENGRGGQEDEHEKEDDYDLDDNMDGNGEEDET